MMVYIIARDVTIIDERLSFRTNLNPRSNKKRIEFLMFYPLNEVNVITIILQI